MNSAKFAAILLLNVIFVCSVKAQGDTVISRYREYLFRTGILQAELTEGWTRNLNSEGQWPDINYNDTEPAGWKPSIHLSRVREMALAWSSPKSKLYHEELLGRKINNALDHWLAKRYKSTNWWHNEIGVPRYMRDIIILLRDDMETTRLKQLLKVMSQLVVHDDYVGGNLIWGADLGLHYGALTNNQALIKHCVKLMLKEIIISTGEGIQPDNSFHQHGKRLQMYQYGKAFAGESIRVAWQLRETRLHFPDDKINILSNFILEGWQWMARGMHTVPGTMDRSASRRGELRSADLRYLIPFIEELQDGKAPSLLKMEAIQNGKGSLTGYRYYPYSDFMVYHRPQFSFFLKTISARTLATESINSENLKGKLLHSGDAYFIRNGEEYFDLLPMWDWAKLPGVTSFKNADLAERRSFVGSLSDSTVGFSAMDYVMKDKASKQMLSARKFWACNEDIVISLIANLNTKEISDTVYTALDQCRQQGKVTFNRLKNRAVAGTDYNGPVNWIHHSNFAYIPLKPALFKLSLKEVEGSWTTINASETSSPVREKLFTPLMIHNAQDEKNSGYVISYCKSPKQAKKLAAKPTWKVLRNDRDCQAVQFNDGAIMAAFYSASRLDVAEEFYLRTEQPCLIMLKNGDLYASDPSHKGINLNIILNKKVIPLALPKDGFTKIVKNVEKAETI